MSSARKRFPLAEAEHSAVREPLERTKSGIHVVASACGDSPRASLSVVKSPVCEGEFAGLDRLDREELDED